MGVYVERWTVMGGLAHSASAASGSAQPQSVTLNPANSHRVRLPLTFNRLYFFVVAWEVDALAPKRCPAASTLEPGWSLPSLYIVAAELSQLRSFFFVLNLNC